MDVLQGLCDLKRLTEWASSEWSGMVKERRMEREGRKTENDRRELQRKRQIWDAECTLVSLGVPWGLRIHRGGLKTHETNIRSAGRQDDAV